MKKGVIYAIFFVLLLNLVSAFEVQSSTSPDDLLRIDLVSCSPSPVQAGQYFDANFKIKNIGAVNADNIRIIFVDKYPFSLKGSKTVEIKRLEPGIGTTFSFTIKAHEDALDGTKTIYLAYEYDQYKKSITAKFDVEVGAPSKIIGIDMFETEPKRIPPGSEAKVKLRIKNFADFIMSDLKIELNISEPFTPLYGTNERRIKSLTPEEYAELEYNLIVDPEADPKPYSVALTITYYDSLGTKYERDDYIGLVIDTKPDYIVNVEESDVMKLNKKGTVTLSVSNVGTSDIRYLALEIMKSEDYEVLFSNKAYIGNLEPDDYETEDFTLFIKRNCWFMCPKAIPLKLLLKYKDNYNQEHEDEKTIDLRVYSGREISKFSLAEKKNHTLIIFLILMVLIYIVYKQYRKEKDLAKAIRNTIIIILSIIVKIIVNIKWKSIKRAYRKTRLFFYRMR